MTTTLTQLHIQMGAFFTNVQLKVLNPNQPDLNELIINYIIQLNTEAGFLKVDDENDADKSVIISISEDRSWISIYDEETEDQHIKKLNKLAANLSKAFKTTALSVLVNDSDSLYVGLNINGVLKDTISNRSRKIDFTKNKDILWSDILTNNYSFDNIITAWQNKSHFVEDFLTELGKFINLDTSNLLTGYEYLNQNKLTKQVKLNFAQKDKKKPPELGLTQFKTVASGIVLDIKTGEKQTAEWIITNEGSASRGLDIMLTGTCIENDLLIPELAKLRFFNPETEIFHEYTSFFIETISTEKEKLFYVTMEDIEIPKGFKPVLPMTTKEYKRYSAIQYKHALTINIRFRGGKEGAGEFTVFFSPLANRQEGSASSTLVKMSLEEWRKTNW